jgi:hypothetical protein
VRCSPWRGSPWVCGGAHHTYGTSWNIVAVDRAPAGRPAGGPDPSTFGGWTSRPPGRHATGSSPGSHVRTLHTHSTRHRTSSSSTRWGVALEPFLANHDYREPAPHTRVFASVNRREPVRIWCEYANTRPLRPLHQSHTTSDTPQMRSQLANMVRMCANLGEHVLIMCDPAPNTRVVKPYHLSIVLQSTRSALITLVHAQSTMHLLLFFGTERPSRHVRVRSPCPPLPPLQTTPVLYRQLRTVQPKVQSHIRAAAFRVLSFNI